MSPGDQLFVFFAGTILFCRGFLFVRPTSSPTIRGFRLHHWMYGAALILLGLLTVSLSIFGVGLGLFVDELALIIVHKHLGKEGSAAYHSWQSTFGTILFMLLIFLLREQLANYFL